MNCAVSLIRTFTNRDTYIATLYLTQLLHQSGGIAWDRIGRLFNHTVAINRGDGFYLIPSFIGDSNFGHWYVILIQISQGQACGYTFDSFGTHNGPAKLTVRNKIMLGFDIPDNRRWIDIPTILQTELKRGPCSIWTMTLICIARKHHIPLQQIFRQITILGGLSRTAAAKQVCVDVQQILVIRSGSFLYSRIFDMVV